METLSDVSNTQNSYSMPSPNFIQQKKIFNWKEDCSFFRKGHLGEKDVDEDAQNQSILDKSLSNMLKPNASLSTIKANDLLAQNKLKGILDVKRKSDVVNIQKGIVKINDEPQQFSVQQKQQSHSALSRQKSILKLWKGDSNKKESQTNLNDILPHRPKQNSESEYNYGFIKSTVLSERMRKVDQDDDQCSQKMTQEEMKIRNIFLKKFEVKRDMKIRKFMRILISRWRSRKLNLREDQLNLINDKAYFYQTSTENQNNCLCRYALRFFSYFGNACQFIPLTNPTNQWKLLWDFYMISVLGIFLYAYSALMFFAQTEKHIDSYYFKFAFTSFCIDIILKFNTSFYSKDSIIQSRVAIAQQYLKSTFAYDFTSAFILGINMNKDNFVFNEDNDIAIYIQNALVLLKIVSFQDKIKHLEQSIPMKEIWRHILSLVGLLASIVIVAHCVAILWNAIGQYEASIGIENNWQAKLGISSESWDVRYIYSLYWSITTMCTVGYGDITPLNPIEVVFVTIDIIFVSTVFAYNINSIGIILSDIAKISKQYKEDLSIMNRFLSRKQVNIDLQFRVKKYLEFLALEEKEVNKKAEDAVIDKLSSHLKEQITIEVNTKILRKYPLFSKNFSEKTLQRLVFIMKEIVVTPNELIIQEGDEDDCSLYLISKGSVEVYSLCDPLYQNQTQNKKVLTQLGKDQCFGELSFFTGNRRTANVRSLSLTSMYKISKNDFIKALQTSGDQDFEKYCMLRDQISYGNLDNMQFPCFSCQEQGHIALECPQITYDADRILRIFRMNYTESQEERQYVRHQKKKQNALKILQSGVIQKAKQSLTQEIEEYMRRLSKINFEYKRSLREQKQQSIAEFDNDNENESKDDSQDISEKYNNSNEQGEQFYRDRSQSQSLFLSEEDDKKKLEKYEEEYNKKDKFNLSEFNQGSYTNSSSRLSSEFRIKPTVANQKELFIHRKSRLNNNSKIFESNSNMKTIQTIQNENIIIFEENSNNNNNDIEKVRQDGFRKYPSEVDIKSLKQKTDEIEIFKTLNKASTINTQTLGLKRNSATSQQLNLFQQEKQVTIKEVNKDGIEKFDPQKSQECDQAYMSEIHRQFNSRFEGDLIGSEKEYMKSKLELEYDRMKIFKSYFPKFNYSQVIRDYQNQKKRVAKLLKYRCKKFTNNPINNSNTINNNNTFNNSNTINLNVQSIISQKKDQQPGFIRKNKRLVLQQIVKNKITDRVHPILYGAAGINKYPYSK